MKRLWIPLAILVLLVSCRQSAEEKTLGELGAKRCTVGILSVKRGPLVCLVYRPYFVVDENTLRSREQIIDCFDTEQQLNEACATLRDDACLDRKEF